MFSGAARAATEIQASFGPIQASIPFSSLETYATNGVIDDELEPYARYIAPDQLQELQAFLSTPVATDLDALTMSHFLYSAPGEVLLGRIGNVVRTRRQNGQIALRAALLLAATDEQGLTPLNIIEKFPTESLVIDFQTGLAIAQDIEQAFSQSAQAIDLIKAQFQASLANTPPNTIPTDLIPSTPKRYNWKIATSSIFLERRAFPVDLYVPDRDTPAPLIIISHGLGSNRYSYDYLAKHLAAAGFAVLVPEHEGSNAKHIQALLTGDAEDVAESAEFINRARDISLILDELTQQSTTNPALINRLDFEHIGVIGQSFGGYTALALGGATLHFENLMRICPTLEDIETGRDRSLNLSLILQCRALDLASTQTSPEPLSLRDERIDAIIAINPIGSAIFGPEGFEDIDIPVLIMAGSADIVAPSLWEQLYPFSWLQTEKFLVAMHQGTHFSTIGTSDEDIPLPEAILGPAANLARSYVQDTGLAFFQHYLVPNPDPTIEALSPTYIGEISRDRMPLSLIRDFDIDDLD